MRRPHKSSGRPLLREADCWRNCSLWACLLCLTTQNNIFFVALASQELKIFSRCLQRKVLTSWTAEEKSEHTTEHENNDAAAGAFTSWENISLKSMYGSFSSMHSEHTPFRKSHEGSRQKGKKKTDCGKIVTKSQAWLKFCRPAHIFYCFTKSSVTKHVCARRPICQHDKMQLKKTDSVWGRMRLELESGDHQPQYLYFATRWQKVQLCLHLLHCVHLN